MSSTTTPTPALFENLGHALSTDYFFLREQLAADELEVLRRVRRFVDDEVLPVIGGYWERAELPWPLIHRLGEMGIVGEEIAGYGCPGLSPIACWAHAHGAQPGRREPRDAGRRAVGPRHEVDCDARLRGAEAAVAARDGPAGEARRVRADRARPRI